MFRKNVVQTVYRYRVSTPWGETATAVIQAESPEAGRLCLATQPQDHRGSLPG